MNKQPPLTQMIGTVAELEEEVVIHQQRKRRAAAIKPLVGQGIDSSGIRIIDITHLGKK